MTNAARSLLIVAAAGAAAFLALKLRQGGDDEDLDFGSPESGPEILDSPLQFAREFFDELTMTNLDALENDNVRAMLKLIRKGEGTSDADGYSRLVGGGRFADFRDHPRLMVYIPRLKITSTAAGAYQFLARTWDEVKAKADLYDFSPHSQDLAAVQRIRDRKALADVLNGRIDAALEKLSYEWASLPPYRYSGQGTLRIADAKAFFLAAGGLIGDTHA